MEKVSFSPSSYIKPLTFSVASMLLPWSLDAQVFESQRAALELRRQALEAKLAERGLDARTVLEQARERHYANDVA
ncbi:MAG TPA: hypothetical protein PLV25_02190, partial [Opitutales bacterium]|nr:hypothetical protein [Opitutales bacterium]